MDPPRFKWDWTDKANFVDFKKCHLLTTRILPPYSGVIMA